MSSCTVANTLQPLIAQGSSGRKGQKAGSKVPRPRRCAQGRTLSKVKGAAITVKCDCGDIRHLSYGEGWACTCGRRWDTHQIPAEEYWGLMRAMRAERIKVIASAGAIALSFVVLALVVSGSFFFLMPVAVSGWYLLFMPRWRARLRAKARAAPTWTLRPE